MTSSNRDPLGYYALLAVSPDTTMHEIRLAYERAVAVAHANRMPFIAELANTAYTSLSNEATRRSYDSGYHLTYDSSQAIGHQRTTPQSNKPAPRHFTGSVAGFDNGEVYKPKSWWEKLLD